MAHFTGNILYIDAYVPPSTGLSDMAADIAAVTHGYAHTALDLAASYQKLEDIQLDILLHGYALAHLPMDLHAGAIVIIDKILDLAISYQKLEDTKLDILTWGDKAQDAKIDGIVAGWARKDKKLDMFICAQIMEAMAMGIAAAKEISNSNARLDMWISNGYTLQDGRLDIITTDGRKLKDMGLDLAVIEVMPAFKAVYAMHLSSVITEI